MKFNLQKLDEINIHFILFEVLQDVQAVKEEHLARKHQQIVKNVKSVLYLVITLRFAVIFSLLKLANPKTRRSRGKPMREERGRSQETNFFKSSTEKGG